MSAVSFASRLLALCVSLWCLSLAWTGASFAADAYPTHPVKIIAPFAAGGPSDFVARLLADKLSQSLGQQFYVEDHAGAGGNIGMTQVARSTPDGYTILVASSSFMVNPSLYAHAPYDPFKDFAPVTLAGASANILLAHPSVPAKTVKDLIALMQANPGKYAIANAGLGTTPELAAELFKLDFKLDVSPACPIAAAPRPIQAVIANQTPLAFANCTPAAPHLLAGTLHGVAVTSAEALRGAARRADHDRRQASRARNPRPCRASLCPPARRSPSSMFSTARSSRRCISRTCRRNASRSASTSSPIRRRNFPSTSRKRSSSWHKVIVDAKIPQIQ